LQTKWLTVGAKTHMIIASYSVSINLADELPDAWQEIANKRE
jgi:hypothetical protein